MSKEKFEKFADTILKKLKSNEDFSKVAKQYSEDIYKSSGGDIGYVSASVFDERVKNEILKLGVGDITDFININDNYYIYKLEDVQQQREKSFEEIKEELKKVLDEQLYIEQFYEYVESLMEKAKIEFIEENIERYF